MPQQIDVPGMGVVEFPDGMSDTQIAAAIKGNTPQRSVSDQLLGTTGPRYQTWPERLARALGQSVTELPSLPERALHAAGDLQRTGDQYDPSAPVEAAMLANPASVAMRAGERIIPGVGKNLQPAKAEVPTAKELAEVGGRDIQAAKTSGLEMSTEAVSNYSRKVQQELFDAGIHPIDAPSTYAKLKELENVPADAIFTAANLQSLRRSLQKTAQNFNPQAASDQVAATRAIKGFDQFIPSLAEKDVLAGTPAATQALFERGRGNYAAGQRSNDITGELDRARTGIEERANARAQAANSGRNSDNTIRQKVEGFLEKPKEVSGLNDAEFAALDRVVQGGRGRNTARYIGNLFGGGGGIGQYVTGTAPVVGGSLGFGVGGPTGAGVGAALGAVPVVTGAVAKSVANALARRDLRAADELLRKRSPLFQERQTAAGMEGIDPLVQALLARSSGLALPQQ